MSAANPTVDLAPDLDADARTNAAWHERFSRHEIQELLRVSDLRGWSSIALDWALVAAAFALVARWPNPLSIGVALFVIGGRQLGLAVLMHEAAHRTLLSDRRWNDRVGSWLCAYPVWSDVHAYRAYHLQHHAKTWTAEDPDLGLVMPFPITRASLRRKVWRDLSGQTGWKQAKAVFRRDVGWSRNGRNQRALGMNEGEQPDVGWHKLVPVALTNGILLAVLALAGHAELYLLWVVAWLTTYRLVTRLRSIAEHGMVPDRLDPLRNTRTTIPRWWERLLIAPNRVNFHLEHHLLMTVPHHNLPRLHRLLRARGAIDEACITPGYLEVVRLATSRT